MVEDTEDTTSNPEYDNRSGVGETSNEGGSGSDESTSRGSAGGGGGGSRTGSNGVSAQPSVL